MIYYMDYQIADTSSSTVLLTPIQEKPFFEEKVMSCQLGQLAASSSLVILLKMNSKYYVSIIYLYTFYTKEEKNRW